MTLKFSLFTVISVERFPADFMLDVCRMYAENLGSVSTFKCDDLFAPKYLCLGPLQHTAVLG